MKTKNIFLIGVTGYIGGALACKLMDKGYLVSAFVRRKEDLAKVQELGIKAVFSPHIESLMDSDAFRQADIVINAADSDDAFLLATLLAKLADSGKMFIHTSGAGIVGDKAEGKYTGTTIYKDIPAQPLLERLGRVVLDREVIRSSERGIHTVVICPSMVYGIGKGLKKESAQIPALMQAAKKYRRAVLIGTGANLTTYVHIEDLTDLYLLAIQHAPSGTFYYAAYGTVSFMAIGKAINRNLKHAESDIGQLSIQEAIDLWGPVMAHFGLGSNILVNSDYARRDLGWSPKYNNLLQEIEETSFM